MLCNTDPHIYSLYIEIANAESSSTNDKIQTKRSRIESLQPHNKTKQDQTITTKMHSNQSNAFFGQYPIREAFVFAQPSHKALHGLPYTTVASSLLGNQPHITNSLTRGRGADKNPGKRNTRRCMSCVNNDKEGKWIFLCCGSSARGKCEYFDCNGNPIKDINEPPANRRKRKQYST